MSSLHIEKLKWDTEHFGFNIGRVSCYNIGKENIHYLVKVAKEQQYSLIYLFTDNEIIDIPHKNLKLVDEKVVFEKFKPKAESCHLPITSYAQEDVSKRMYDITYECGKYSRFKLDSKFSDESFRSMYAKWLNKSLDKTIADDVLIYKDNNDILGFLTYKIVADVCIIGLVGVHPTVQNKRVGTRLLQKLDLEMSLKNITRIEVATQLQNSVACRFYEKNNFKIKNIKYIYHLWL